jgi:hypothetical protein
MGTYNLPDSIDFHACAIARLGSCGLPAAFENEYDSHRMMPRSRPPWPTSPCATGREVGDLRRALVVGDGGGRRPARGASDGRGRRSATCARRQRWAEKRSATWWRRQRWAEKRSATWWRHQRWAGREVGDLRGAPVVGGEGGRRPARGASGGRGGRSATCAGRQRWVGRSVGNLAARVRAAITRALSAVTRRLPEYDPTSPNCSWPAS